MLDMGFLPSMRKLVGDTDMPGKGDRQTLMFSATFPEEVQRLAQEILGDSYLYLVVGRVGGANLDIEQTIHNVDSLNKREKVLSILNESVLLLTRFVWLFVVRFYYFTLCCKVCCTSYTFFQCFDSVCWMGGNSKGLFSETRI